MQCHRKEWIIKLVHYFSFVTELTDHVHFLWNSVNADSDSDYALNLMWKHDLAIFGLAAKTQEKKKCCSFECRNEKAGMGRSWWWGQHSEVSQYTDQQFEQWRRVYLI